MACIPIDKYTLSVAERGHLLEVFLVRQGQEVVELAVGFEHLVLFLDFEDVLQTDLLLPLLRLVLLHSRRTLQDVVGVDVEFEVVHLLDLDGFDGGEDVADVEGFVGDQDEVDFLVDQPVEEDVVPSVRARLDQMEIVDHQHEVGVGVSVEGLQRENVPNLRVLQDVGFEIGLVLFLHLLSVDYVHSVLKHAPLNEHASDLFEESGLATAVVAADMDVLGLALTAELSEHFVDLLPFAVDELGTPVKFAVDVVRLAVAGGDVLVGSRHNLDGVLFVLDDFHLDLLELLAETASQLLEYLSHSLLRVVDVDQPLDQLLRQRNFTLSDLVVTINHPL